MTVPKKQRNKFSIHICSKTGDEGSIYAARQGMRAVQYVYVQQDRGWGHATIIACVTP